MSLNCVWVCFKYTQLCNIFAVWRCYYFQDLNRWHREMLNYFHDLILSVLLGIFFFIFSFFILLFFNGGYKNLNFYRDHVTEMLWTFSPVLVLLIIATPSLWTLYLLEDTGSPLLTVVVIGHQWYWTYEYNNLLGINFRIINDRYIVKNSVNRTLYRRCPIWVPKRWLVNLLIRREDVIHSWTVPCLGLKVDAVPGRLNQVSFRVDRTGSYYGQCSEICGSSHRYMPIHLCVLTSEDFWKGLKNLFM